jgi:hypothetical protein
VAQRVSGSAQQPGREGVLGDQQAGQPDPEISSGDQLPDDCEARRHCADQRSDEHGEQVPPGEQEGDRVPGHHQQHDRDEWAHRTGRATSRMPSGAVGSSARLTA